MLEHKKIFNKIVTSATATFSRSALAEAKKVIKEYDNPKTSEKLYANLIVKRLKRERQVTFILTYRRIDFRSRFAKTGKRHKKDVFNPTVFLEHGSPKYKNFKPPLNFYQKAKEKALNNASNVSKVNNRSNQLINDEVVKALQKL